MEEYIDPFPLFFDDEDDDETLEKSTDDEVQLLCHKHPLYPTKVSSRKCVGCGKVRVDPGGGYACDSFEIFGNCEEFYVHKSCLEVPNPTNPSQPLSLTAALLDVSRCSVCERFVGLLGYSFPFSPGVLVCKRCVKKKPYIEPKKSHEHPLLVLIKAFMSFVCDACGENNDQSCLCLCIECRFTIHRHCVNLPRVICVNRHDHRIYHVPRLTQGEWDCGICRKKIDWRYGAYSCSTCSFVAHSRCATRDDVWDGIELEGVPEDDPEDIMPFKVVAEGVIKHFGHQHNLSFTTEEDILHDKYKQCYACILPIFSDPCYTCMDCDFILHERCANFPRKIRHMSNKKQFTLDCKTQGIYGVSLFTCDLCCQVCNGFRYKVGLFNLDVRCVLIYDGYVHKSQPDAMLVASDHYSHYSVCSSCGIKALYRLIFTGHDHLSMCHRCATMPAQVIYKYDDHLLSLRFDENSTSDYWCEICEEILNPRKWFYTCDECCTTVHVDCVLGKQPYLRLGSTYMTFYNNEQLEVIPNNFASRPSCHSCNSRIVNASVCRIEEYFFCSQSCAEGCMHADWRHSPNIICWSD